MALEEEEGGRQGHILNLNVMTLEEEGRDIITLVTKFEDFGCDKRWWRNTVWHCKSSARRHSKENCIGYP